jgi:hypothetical protein
MPMDSQLKAPVIELKKIVDGQKKSTYYSESFITQRETAEIEFKAFGNFTIKFNHVIDEGKIVTNNYPERLIVYNKLLE